MQPDGSGVQFIYLNDGRMISSAKIVGNIADDAMLDLLSTAEGFRKLVHSIGVSVEMDSADKKTVFELQMYGKSTCTARARRFAWRLWRTAWSLY